MGLNLTSKRDMIYNESIMRYIYPCAADGNPLGFSHVHARGRESDALVFRLNPYGRKTRRKIITEKT